MSKNITFKTGMRQVFLVFSLILIIASAACSSSGYSTKSGRHKAPASTGKKRCGCSMLNPATFRVIDYTHPKAYDLQA